ncbi:diguanylate cyclase [Gallionella capsiferriformans]|uniref:diguanylate cyclase n=1 Tax=Gallionella capsiferriformans (strain ES-2) TaxID=395494 RepID=D9SER2_GALCS|nr:diguanylate cyclase [Gallionella capsiferriformans]ADL55009.1 response regulator receiver modulated diguanylate cyclase [Gallionella capsiferriformans ES-2]
MNQFVNQKFADLKANGNLPSPRGVALQIIQLADKENTTTQQIARLISSDPALAGRIIKVANLLVHREGRPIASIMDAVTVQGIKSVRQLALSLSLVADFRSGACCGFDYQKFWAHSVCTGIAAQQIAAKMHVGVADEAFLLGLLSQIGRLALSTLFAEEYSQVLEHATTDNLSELESNAFGINHNQITALMLSDWGMPALFQDIALHIEQPESSEFHEGERNWRLLHLFHFSDRLASVCMLAPSERYRQIPKLMLVATRVGIETSALIEIGDSVIRGLREWADLLNIEIPDIPPFDEMLNSASIASELMSVDAQPSVQPAIFKLHILLVDDDRAIRLLYKALLEKSGHSVTTANNGREALESVKASPPQLIISDWMMPEMDGIEFCRELRKNPDWHRIYVFIVTAQESTEKLIEAFEAGANDYLSKPINPKVLAARLRSAQRIVQMQEAQEEDRLQLRQFADELALSNKRLQALAVTDALTGLPNRRYMMERLEQEWALATRAGRPVCCMMVDIDHFKMINDTYGHQLGDEALKLVASSLQQAMRKQDVLCRVGGEEFMVICPDSDNKAGFIYAERLRQHVAFQPVLASGKSLRLTVSIGLADNAGLASPEAMMHQADLRLYAAKAAGRNCTIIG